MAFGGLSNPRFCVLLSPALTARIAASIMGLGLSAISRGHPIIGAGILLFVELLSITEAQSLKIIEYEQIKLNEIMSAQQKKDAHVLAERLSGVEFNELIEQLVAGELENLA